MEIGVRCHWSAWSSLLPRRGQREFRNRHGVLTDEHARRFTSRCTTSPPGKASRSAQINQRETISNETHTVLRGARLRSRNVERDRGCAQIFDHEYAVFYS